VVQPWQVVGFHSPGSSPSIFLRQPESAKAFIAGCPNEAAAPVATDNFKKSLRLIFILFLH
jgi:hypothetical protein